IIAPSGSDDPFYYQIEQHYGSSDHEVFNHWSTHVPGVMLITWPDLYYHTSEDIPNKLDPTQLKRATIIAAAGAYTIASADEDMAISIANTSFSYASKRMGVELARAFDELQKSNSENFEAICKKVNSYLEAATNNERATLLSISELEPHSEKLQSHLSLLVESLEQNYETNGTLLKSQMKIVASKLGVNTPLLNLSKLEKNADEIIPVPADILKESGFGIERTIRELSKETIDKYSYRSIASTTELCALINGNNSVLDIKKMLDTQYKKESDLQDIINYLELLKMKDLVIF
ncbi:MAG: hypothetical protein GQ525_16655, partial [Draconibacterium sp.]|nr:hypothetical protein [Draconibacterium sp.]